MQNEGRSATELETHEAPWHIPPALIQNKCSVAGLAGRLAGRLSGRLAIEWLAGWQAV